MSNLRCVADLSALNENRRLFSQTLQVLIFCGMVILIVTQNNIYFLVLKVAVELFLKINFSPLGLPA